MAPYTIAHLKLSLFLQAQGWNPADTEHLGIYLTNTLEEPVERERFAFAGFISDEANAAVSVSISRFSWQSRKRFTSWRSWT